MSINTLDFKTKLTNGLDKAIMQKSVTSFMQDNVLRTKFVGARTVIIPDVDFVGLGDYDRDTGFAQGGVTVTHKSYSLTKDRGRTFTIDREDMDEIGVSNLAGQLMGEFVRCEVVPEIDAYTLSNLANIAVQNSQTEAFAAGESVAENCVSMLTRLINNVYDVIGYGEEIVAFLNPAFYSALMSTPELTRRINVGDFKKGEISTQVQMFNDCALIPVPDARMKTAYVFNDGATAGQTDGGFAAAAGASSIGALVLPKNAASQVKKTEKVRIFEPDENQALDAYKFDYRIYYDAFVKNSKKGGVFAYVY